VLALGLAAASVLVLPARADDRTDSASADAQIAMAMDFSQAFERVAAKVSPAVVSITASSGPSQQQMTQNDLFRRFFGDQFGGMGGGQPRPQIQFGSGVIVSDEGYILTNNHVVEDATDLRVQLSNNATFPARLIGRDPDTDVAVIQLQWEEGKKPDLSPAKLGDLTSVKPGQWVLAIGSPFNLSQTVTAGIVSSISRGTAQRDPMGGGLVQRGITNYDNFIQTDAAINPGNSGGPLVNLRGEVIGINTAIFSRSGGSVGIGFAIPINLARHIMDSLITTGKVARGGFLGVSTQVLDRDMSASLGFKGTDGVLVTEVSDDSPAAKAGIAVEDIIVSVDGLPVRDPASLSTVVRRLAPGGTVAVVIVRAGETLTKQVTLGERQLSAVDTTENPLGAAIREVTDDERIRLNIPAGIGVVITRLEDWSQLARRGVQVGDVILSVGNVRVDSTAQFTRLMTELKAETERPRGDMVRIRVASPRGVMIIAFNLREKRTE
jgi:serine protease Do